MSRDHFGHDDDGEGKATVPKQSGAKPAQDAAPAVDWSAMPVEERPGFLIRRAQQIHTALFTRETAPERVNPIMYSVLSSLRAHGRMDQTGLARRVAIDKTNLADLLDRLSDRGLVRRTISTADRRVRFAAITKAGLALLDQMDAPVARAHAQTIEALDPEEQALFVEFLARIVRHSEDNPVRATRPTRPARPTAAANS